MNVADKDEFWFAPKRFGYGSGMPVRWQGWALVAAHGLAVLAGTPLVERHPNWFAGYAVFVSLIFMPLYAAKTEGGWHWRWGGK
jgi:hypothetical protein